MVRFIEMKLVAAAVIWLVLVIGVRLDAVDLEDESLIDDLGHYDSNTANEFRELLLERNGVSPTGAPQTLWTTDTMVSTQPSVQTGGSTTSLALYKQPSSWLITLLKGMFSDIDWETIEEAQVQIEKFVHRVEQMVGKFRNVFTMVGGGASSKGVNSAQGRQADAGPMGRLWGKGGQSASKLDATRVKEMLERVACFVGYARLMNLSNEALAELDASKVVTNLFSSGKRNSSGWKWFG